VAPGGVEISGNLAVSPEELKPLIRLEAGEPFIASRLSALEGAIQQIYRTATVLRDRRDRQRRQPRSCDGLVQSPSS
jgi:hypothetical protein